MAKQSLTVQLYYSGSWHSVPAYARNPVRITRERRTGSEPTPFTATVTLQGFINPKDPFSLLYGVAGRNTPIRFTLPGDTRFYGEVASWQPQRSLNFDPIAGKGDAWTTVTANGILRRLGQGSESLRSPMFRTMSGVAPGDYIPHAYWSLEDGQDATQFASGLAGSLPMTFNGSVTPAGDSDLVGSDPLPTFAAGAVAVGLVAAYSTTSQWVVQFAMKVDAEPVSETVFLDIQASGSGKRLVVSVIPGSPAEVWLSYYNSSGVKVQVTGIPLTGTDPDNNPAESAYFGQWATYTVLSRVDSGSTWEPMFGMTVTDTFGVIGGTIEAGTHGSITSVKLLGGNGASFGHVGVWVDPTFDYTTDADNIAIAAHGYTGEQAHERLERLCLEEGIPLTIEGSESQLLGPQPADTLAALFAECERTDDGMLFEPRDDYGLIYRCGRERLNRSVALTLDWTLKEVAPPLMPVLDDLTSRNDVTARRPNGSEARAVLETGALSVLEPPDGIGRYTTSINVNTSTDEALTDHAHWHLHKGTIDGVRYELVTVDLDASPTLATDASAVDIDDVIELVNLPEQYGASTVRLHVVGCTENIGSHRRTITFNCVPAATFDVGVWGSDAKGSRYGAKNTVLAEDLTISETIADVTATGETWITTGSHPSRFPFNVDIGGLTYSCTAIVGATPNYQLTLVRLLDDKAHSTGDAVTVTDTGRYGL